MPVRTERLTEALSAVTEYLVADASLEEVLNRVAVAAQEAIEPAAAAGLTLLDELGRPTTPVASNELAPRVDQAQYADNEGPCLAAYREDRTVRVDDTRAQAARWPAFSRRAVEEGIGSSLSLPLRAGGEVYGALNLYGRDQHAFNAQDEADAGLFAKQAAVVLVNAQAYWQLHDLAASLQYALQSRATVEQAQGIIMANQHCTADEAFQVLVAASQRTNVGVHDLAARLVDADQARRARSRTGSHPERQP